LQEQMVVVVREPLMKEQPHEREPQAEMDLS
jgi:hypothetical protein